MKWLWSGAGVPCSTAKLWGLPVMLPSMPHATRAWDGQVFPTAMSVLIQDMTDVSTCWIHHMTLDSPTLSHLNQLQINTSLLMPLGLCVLHGSGHSLWTQAQTIIFSHLLFFSTKCLRPPRRLCFSALTPDFCPAFLSGQLLILTSQQARLLLQEAFLDLHCLLHVFTAPFPALGVMLTVLFSVPVAISTGNGMEHAVLALRWTLCPAQSVLDSSVTVSKHLSVKCIYP